ncbi:MAG: hypothetical protein HFJ72_07270 [Adlercreutzia sp.]|nr:hypothetical protein [Adlercreutzia sp.]
MISEDRLRDAIGQLAAVPAVEFDPVSLAEDVLLLGHAYEQEAAFVQAVASVCRALRQIASNQVTSARLKYSFAGYDSYHFQSKREQGASADLRIVYQQAGDVVRVLGFGNRKIPSDIYERLASTRIEG